MRTIPPLAARLYRVFGGRRYPRIMVDAARRELDAFVRLLEAEGIVVVHARSSSDFSCAKVLT